MKTSDPFIIFLLLISLFAGINAQTMNANRLKIKKIDSELDVKELDSKAWDASQEIAVGKYWSGKVAPDSRQFKARLLWSDTALYVRFAASQDEPLIASDKPDLSQKTLGLWDNDVCEIFIAPSAFQRNKYFEFEISPTGEWVDLGITFTSQGRKTDLDYKSGMTSSAAIEKGQVVMAMKIPFASLGRTPKVGDIWLGNLFRCIGKDPTRGYLSWQPTKTKTPNFHVPKAFGEFEFTKQR